MDIQGLPKSLVTLIEYFSRLPGIGKKTAFRLAFSLLQKTPEYQSNFADALSGLTLGISTCTSCFHLCESHETTCDICQNPKREKRTLCIVETSLDLLALERSHSYFGKYFVLGGVLSPMDGIGPDEIRIKEVIEYTQTHDIEEVIFALSSTMEGEATATYLWRKFEESTSVEKISRIARGIPLGSSLQYTDENTLVRAFEGRQSF